MRHKDPCQKCLVLGGGRKRWRKHCDAEQPARKVPLLGFERLRLCGEALPPEETKLLLQRHKPGIHTAGIPGWHEQGVEAGSPAVTTLHRMTLHRRQIVSSLKIAALCSGSGFLAAGAADSWKSSSPRRFPGARGLFPSLLQGDGGGIFALSVELEATIPTEPLAVGSKKPSLSLPRSWRSRMQPPAPRAGMEWHRAAVTSVLWLSPRSPCQQSHFVPPHREQPTRTGKLRHSGTTPNTTHSCASSTEGREDAPRLQPGAGALLEPAWSRWEALQREQLRVNNHPLKGNDKSFVMFHTHLL